MMTSLTSIFDFEQVSLIALVFPLLALNKEMPTGWERQKNF